MTEMPKSSISFMTKSEFIERKGSECFSVMPEVEEKLKGFKPEDILAIDVDVNSPAVVTDVHLVEGIVDFMNQRFEDEGLTRDEINQSFDKLV